MFCVRSPTRRHIIYGAIDQAPSRLVAATVTSVRRTNPGVPACRCLRIDELWPRLPRSRRRAPPRRRRVLRRRRRIPARRRPRPRPRPSRTGPCAARPSRRPRRPARRCRPSPPAIRSNNRARSPRSCSAASARPTRVIQLPPGVYLPTGANLVIDDKTAPLTAVFTHCLQTCMAEGRDQAGDDPGVAGAGQARTGTARVRGRRTPQAGTCRCRSRASPRHSPRAKSRRSRAGQSKRHVEAGLKDRAADASASRAQAIERMPSCASASDVTHLASRALPGSDRPRRVRAHHPAVRH